MPSIINAATSGGLISTADTSGVLQLQTASTTALTITAAQNVGIGTASPATKLAVAGNTINFGTNPFIALSNAVGTTPTYIQQQNTSTGTLTILTSGTGSNGNIAVQVGTGSTNALNVLSNGTTQFSTVISVGGATPTTSGFGITFPASQSASSDANTLDDYEEGTFTPVIVGGTTPGTGTYGAQVGNYTKIGRQVFYQIYFQLSNHTGTGGMFVSGLPFTVSSISSNNAYSPTATWMNNLALTANNILMAYPDPGATTITLNQGPTGGGSLAGIPVDTSFQLMLAGNYFA
jgi:hypothetical protein